MMLKTLQALAVAGIFALLTAVSTMAGANDAGTSERFQRLDRSGDGFISRDEAKDAEELNTRFTELDANNDNKLSRDEYTVLQREASAPGSTARSAGVGATTKPAGKRPENPK